MNILAYNEKFKFKKNKTIRKKRYEDRKRQEENLTALFKVIVRAKHKRHSIQTIVINILRDK